MFAMQYGFDLPDDFDMGTIRVRVAERGRGFDHLSGLFQKAFLISEVSKQPEQGNRYCPMYLWQDPTGMSDFLLSDKFRAVSQTFGRPVVTTWTPVSFSRGEAVDAVPVSATQQFIPIAHGADVAEACSRERRLLQADAVLPGLHSAFLGLDANAWQLMRFHLWTGAVRTKEGSRFEVLHLSAPGLHPPPFES